VVKDLFGFTLESPKVWLGGSNWEKDMLMKESPEYGLDQHSEQEQQHEQSEDHHADAHPEAACGR